MSSIVGSRRAGFFAFVCWSAVTVVKPEPEAELGRVSELPVDPVDSGRSGFFDGKESLAFLDCFAIVHSLLLCPSTTRFMAHS
jgi:hypothetical protein